MEGLAHCPHLHADVIDGGVDAQLPVVEHLGGVLHVAELVGQLVLHRRDAVQERDLETVDVAADALNLVVDVVAEGLHFVEDKLEIWFHGAQLSAETGEMIVVDGVGFQIGVVGNSSTDQINLGLDL